MTDFASLSRDDRSSLVPLFRSHRPSFLIDAIVEGHLGSALVDDGAAPSIARLTYADVVVFGGDSAHPVARNLAETVPCEKGILPAPGGWRDLLAAIHGENLVADRRIAFSDEALDLSHLLTLADRLPAGYALKRIDLDLAQQIDADPSLLTEDHVRNFDSPDDFVQRGVGFVVLDGEQIVSGASSYAFCNAGIEIQVNTHPAFRGRGLATAVSARLIAHCLQQGLRAHWDTGNDISARLAERLGYVPAEKYEVAVRVR